MKINGKPQKTHIIYLDHHLNLHFIIFKEKSSNDTAVSFNKIPCSVCADDSSGLHFGAITCEGCIVSFIIWSHYYLKTYVLQKCFFLIYRDFFGEMLTKPRNLCAHQRAIVK